MLLPAGCVHDGCDRRSRPILQHCEDLSVLGTNTRFNKSARGSIKLNAKTMKFSMPRLAKDPTELIIIKL
jgi:hypothetical protein